MRFLKMRFYFFCLLIALVGGIGAEASAQGVKRIVVSTAAGGPFDSMVRGLTNASVMKSSWGNPIVTENQPGTMGMAALNFARNLPNDGSAMLAINIFESGENAVASASVMAALAEFVPIAYLGGGTSQTGAKYWYGLYGPPGMPRDLAGRLGAVVQGAMQSAELLALTGRLTGWSQDRPAGAATLAQLTGHSGTAQAGGAKQSDLTGITPGAASSAGYPHGSNSPSICEAPDGYENARPVKVSEPHNPNNSAMHCVCLTRDRPVNGVPMFKFVNRCAFAVTGYFFYRPGSYTLPSMHARGGANDYAYNPANERFAYYFCKNGMINAAGSLLNGQVGCR